MTEIGDWLRAADPLADAAPPSPDDIARLRAAAMGAAAEQVNTQRTWPGASVVAVTIVSVFAVTAWFEQRAPIVQQTAVIPTVDINSVSSVTDVAPATVPGGDIRQLQFATSGGTRIIWVFNPEFRLRGE